MLSIQISDMDTTLNVVDTMNTIRATAKGTETKNAPVKRTKLGFLIVEYPNV